MTNLFGTWTYLNLNHLNRLILQRFDLQLNIQEHNPVVKRDPTVYVFFRTVSNCDNLLKCLSERVLCWVRWWDHDVHIRMCLVTSGLLQVLEYHSPQWSNCKFNKWNTYYFFIIVKPIIFFCSFFVCTNTSKITYLTRLVLQISFQLT